jgi:hypothetical protein
MSSRTLAIWAEELMKYQARHELRLLDITTYPDWSGHMDPPPATTPEQRALRKAQQEGNEARRAFRDGLQRQAWPEQWSDDGELRTNEHGDLVDRRGVIHARNAKHIHEILARPK